MKRILLIVVAIAISIPLGCGGNADKGSPATISAAKSIGSDGKLVASNGTSNAIIPPNEIVAMFADSIRRGDRETVNKLITDASREEIKNQGIDLDPPGSPDASYKIGSFRYSDEDKDSGFVESLWIEPAQDGNLPQSTEVVWGVRLENGGWRICGLAIDMGKDQPAALVNFEDLEGTVTPESTSNDKVANQAPASSFTPGSGFASPSLQNSPALPNTSSTQIASPPATDNRR